MMSGKQDACKCEEQRKMKSKEETRRQKCKNAGDEEQDFVSEKDQ